MPDIRKYMPEKLKMVNKLKMLQNLPPHLYEQGKYKEEGYELALDDCYEALKDRVILKEDISVVDIGNLINEFTYENRKGDNGLYAITNKEGFELAQSIVNLLAKGE